MNISKNHIQGDNILQYLTVFNSIQQYLSISNKHKICAWLRKLNKGKQISTRYNKIDS